MLAKDQIMRYITTVCQIGWLWLCICVGLTARGQEDDAARQMVLAENYYSQGNYREALAIYKRIEAKNTRDGMLQYLIGRCYMHSEGSQFMAVPYFEKARRLDPNNMPPEIEYYMGVLAQLEGLWSQAKSYYKAYEKLGGQGKRLLFSDAQIRIAQCDSGDPLVLSGGPPKLLSSLYLPVNSSQNEVYPIVSRDGQRLIFSSDLNRFTPNRVEQGVLFPTFGEKRYTVYQTSRKGLSWAHPEPLDISGIDAYPYVVALAMTQQEDELLLFMGKDPQQGDLYIATARKNGWNTPKKLVFNNLKFKDLRIEGACFTRNGRSIIFSANIPEGLGGMDLYRSNRQSGNRWSYPENLGSSINSAQDDVTPFMHADNKTLYFSSNRAASMGGFDLFKAIELEAEYSKPENLGVLMNTPWDEKHPVKLPSEIYTFFSSNRLTTKDTTINSRTLGRADLWEVFEKKEINEFTILQGHMSATRKGQRVALNVKIVDNSDKKEVRMVYSPLLSGPNPDQYFALLLSGRSYEMIISTATGNQFKRSIDIPRHTYRYQLDLVFEFMEVVVAANNIGEEMKPVSSNFERLDYEQVSDTAARSVSYDGMMLALEHMSDHMDQSGINSLNELMSLSGVKIESDKHFDRMFEVIHNTYRVPGGSEFDPIARNMFENLGQIQGPFRSSFLLKGTYETTQRKRLFESPMYDISDTLTLAQMHTLDDIASLCKKTDHLLEIRIAWWNGIRKTDPSAVLTHHIETLRKFFKSYGLTEKQVLVERHPYVYSSTMPDTHIPPILIKVYQIID